MTVLQMPYCKSARVDIDLVFMCMHGPHIMLTAYERLNTDTHIQSAGTGCTATTDCKTNFGSASATPIAQSVGVVLLPLIVIILEVQVLR
jgi:hypothetical protein